MELTGIVTSLWADMDHQNWSGLPPYFAPGASILWPNTSERFSVDGFTRANREYPGKWSISVERLEQINDLVVSVALVRLAGGDSSFYATSFFEFDSQGRITRLTEYWSENAPPPEWRKVLNLNT